MKRLVAVVLLSAVTCLISDAQQGESAGTFRGIVTDPGGGILVGAAVTARNQATAVQTSALTNESGAYTMANLPIGVYDLEISFAGFKTVRVAGLRLISGTTLTQDVALTLGDTTQVVSVTAEAELVGGGSSTIGTTRVLEEIKDLPLQNNQSWRAAGSFLFTLPGFNPDDRLTDTEQVIGRGTHMGVGGSNGFASGFSGYTIDGVNAASAAAGALEDNGPLVPELVSEVRYTTNLNAESGNHLGSSVVLVTKSGTNQFHGTAFETFRNEFLDARNFQVAKVARARQNEYGFVLGGPIIKNKMFFFGSWDSYHMKAEGGSFLVSVPTLRMRRGDFTEWLGPQIGTDALGRPVARGQIFDPLDTVPDGRGSVARQPFPGNIIPTSRISPISNFFQPYYAEPNLPGTQLNWFGPGNPEIRDYDRWAVKVDNDFWQNHRLTVGLDIMPNRSIGPGSQGAVGAATRSISGNARDDRQYRLRIVENWTPRPDMVVSVRIGFTRYKFMAQIPSENLNLGCKAGMTGTLACSAPLTMIEQESAFGFLRTRQYRFWTTVPADADMSWHKGKHDLKFGGQFQQQVSVNVNDTGSNGSFSFGATGTGQPGITQSGVGYASYLLGQVNTGSLSSARANKYFARYFAVFAQDQWRVTPRLTINYGLRWETTVPMAEKWDRIGSFDPTVPNAAVGGRLGALTFWGDGTGRNGRHTLVNQYWKAFGPRLGIAYSLNSKTAIRAFYGLLFAPMLGDLINGEQTVDTGWGFTVSKSTLDAGLNAAFNWNAGFPRILPTLPTLDPTFLNANNITYYDPTDNRPARSQNLGFTLERQVGGDMVVKAEYVGKYIHGLDSQGYYVPNFNDLNIKYLPLGSLLQANISSAQAQAAGIPLPYPGYTGGVAQALRPYPQYGSISMNASRSHWSLYNALLLTVQKRYRHGLSFLAGYTISKMFERASTFQNISQQGVGKTLMAYDKPQVVNLSYSYVLPFGPGKKFLQTNNGFVRRIVEGWQVSGTHTYSVGIPVSVTSRGTIPGFSAQFPKVNPNVPVLTGSSCSAFDNAYPSGQYAYLNRAAFYSPGPFTLGDTRTLPNVRQCGGRSENFTLIKSFRVKEGIQVRVGGAFFNIFNRHIWSGLQTDIDTPATFGRFISTSSPRTGQLWMKVEF